MPGTKEIRVKIKSVQNTRKITKAMEMVAASKMKKAQERMRAGRPYARRILSIAMHAAQANAEYKHPLLTRRAEVKRVGAVVITTDKGLCGGLNTNLLRVVLNQHKDWTAKGIEVEYCTIGNKGFFDGVEVKKALAFESALRQYLHAKYKGLVDRIDSTKDLTADDEKALEAAMEDFKKNGAY
jgi:ATP synthase F1 gamma subunit